MATQHTGALLEAATALRDLGDQQISASGDPLTMIRDMHASLSALQEAWPSVAKAAHFDAPVADEDPKAFEEVAAFVNDIQRGLDLAVDGLRRAADSI
jgi:hypothetical protein